MTFHQLSSTEVLQELHSSPSTGLNSQQVEERLEQFGENKLREKKKKSNFQRFLAQFKDVMILILLAAAAVSFAIACIEGQPKEFFEPVLILLIVILNAIMGVMQESKAEKALEALKNLSAPHARVIRDGKEDVIDAAQLVPGDIIHLEAGDFIPADARLLRSVSLKCEESALTGESVPSEKDADAVIADNAPLGDRCNMVYSGCSVTYGTAAAVVTATGMNTEMGRIANLLDNADDSQTPLQKKLAQLGKYLGVLALAACGIIFVVGLVNGIPPLEIFMTAVSLAVSAIPEGLPAIVTVVLSIGVQRMVRKNALIRRLPAVETLGSASVICSDKTGTLTQNRMTVEKIYADGKLCDGCDLELANDAQRLLLKTALLASDATHDAETGTSIGDPTEVALVLLGENFGVEESAYRSQHQRLGELAFDSDRKLMTTLQEIEGVPTLMTKGAIDVLLARSDRLMTSKGVRELTEADREEIMRVNNSLSEEGLRVLAFGYRELDCVRELSLDDEQGYVFIGLISMIDPPRPESVAAVADAKRAGIRTVMITGDHKVTATAIAKRIGIFGEGDLAVSGPELEQMTDEELDRKLTHISVYARVSPEHKIRIVTAWQRRGQIVAMTGDGVNDAPALKKADIGVAMGITGTEVSKDAAAMILADDNFATIVNAVTNGRGVYENIKNVIGFLLSGNMAGIFCVLYASLMALPAPFAAVHLLFINLLTDSLPAIAIGMEPASSDLLNRKPRDPKEPLLSGDLVKRIGLQGLLIAVPVMTAFYLGYQTGTAEAMTMAFATLTLARLFHGFNCREDRSILRMGLSGNPTSLAAFGVGVLLLLAVLLIPALHGLFLVADLTLAQLGMILGLAVLPTLCIQITRIARGK